MAKVQVTASYLKKNVLSRELFDNFMKNEKPYLNPDVNRTYISNFVNSEYGINFSCYINSYRSFQRIDKGPRCILV